MTPLRQRMIDTMVLRGFAARTQESYADAIYAMAKVPAKKPKLLGHSHISTTSRYLHLISPQFRPPKDVDPLDLLAGLPKL